MLGSINSAKNLFNAVLQHDQTLRSLKQVKDTSYRVKSTEVNCSLA